LHLSALPKQLVTQVLRAQEKPLKKAELKSAGQSDAFFARFDFSIWRRSSPDCGNKFAGAPTVKEGHNENWERCVLMENPPPLYVESGKRHRAFHYGKVVSAGLPLMGRA
jgi:hypothetical protein